MLVALLILYVYALITPSAYSFVPLVSFCEKTATDRHSLRRRRRHGHPFLSTTGSLQKNNNFQLGSKNGNEDERELNGIRLNKVFKANYSRRQADALIESGRVSVNGRPVEEKGGFRVIPFVDTVALDGVVIEGWEAMNGIVDAAKRGADSIPVKSPPPKTSSENSREIPTIITPTKTITKTTDNFEYIKFWKPRGVTCTTDRSIRSNIMDELMQRRGYQPKHRVYPVGRLDRDTSGLILLTSDGRLPNSALRGQFKQPKVYQVLVDKPISDQDLQQLRNGVVITTIAQRTGTSRGKTLTASTLPCDVERIPGAKQRGVTMTLVEGRNRQIRKMMAALEYEVVELHRIQFMGITLDPLQQEGDWKDLDSAELQLVDDVLLRAAASTNTANDGVKQL